MYLCGILEIKWHYQSGGHLRRDHRYGEQFFPDVVRRKVAQLLYGARLADERTFYLDFEVPEKCHKKLFFLKMLWKARLLCSQVEKIV